MTVASSSGDPISEQKYRPFLEAIETENSDFGVTGMGWAGLAGWAGLGWAGWLGWAGLGKAGWLGLQEVPNSVPESSVPFGRGPPAVGRSQQQET